MRVLGESGGLAQSRSEKFAEAVRDGDVNQDYGDDFNGFVESNMQHLTLSDIALKFFNKHEVLHDFKPLVDQISATNWLDWNGCEFYKYQVDGLILNLNMAGYGQTQEESRVLGIARMYLHQLIDGCKGGYRGKLVTEVRRTYNIGGGGEPQKKKRFGF